MRKAYITLAILLIVIAISGFLFYLHNKKDKSAEDTLSESASKDVSEAIEGFVPFFYEAHDMSFLYPPELSAVPYVDDSGETIVFSDNDPNSDAGFQIFIAPITVEGEGKNPLLTPQKIKEDIPGISIIDPTTVVLGDNVHALLFWSEDSSIGRTREVWFVYDGFLYEFTAYESFDLTLAGILSTLDFPK